MYYDLEESPLKFVFPEPGPLQGIKRRETPILKLTNVTVKYPQAESPQLTHVNLQCSLSSRIAVVGANGAGTQGGKLGKLDSFSGMVMG